MDYVSAFIVGGLICVIAQILMDRTKLTPARILVIFVTLGAILGGFGIYDKLIEIGGAGATIPLPSFGNSLADAAIIRSLYRWNQGCSWWNYSSYIFWIFNGTYF